MRKKLDTRFPAARIKKIMQSDEDVGKIAMAVPLLVSKALELFLQDLCDRTYEVTLQRGAKTLNSMHLKQCVQSFNVFDFLRDTVGKVPDLGGSDAAGESAPKRRKVVDGDHNDGDEIEDSKKDKQPEIHHASGSGRGRGRGRGRGGGRPSRAEKEANAAAAFNHEKHEINPVITNEPKPKSAHVSIQDAGSKENIIKLPDEKTENMVKVKVKVRNFDLNVDLDENGNTPIVPTVEMKPDKYPGWSLAEVEKMGIDPVKLASLNSSRVDEDEEDYGEEG
ncbi:uncharacterized protein LOC143586331 [Bidens hawaiensis]|uniref:uncharacterized protein LOC143586331 n=1 Tax=Bidens hawaiensis TaxID=980011 RepID=UPI00404977A4